MLAGDFKMMGRLYLNEICVHKPDEGGFPILSTAGVIVGRVATSPATAAPRLDD